MGSETWDFGGEVELDVVGPAIEGDALCLRTTEAKVRRFETLAFSAFSAVSM